MENKIVIILIQSIMAQSLSKMYIHLVFHIKSTSPTILDKDIDRVHAYLGQMVNSTGCVVISVGGIEDHVHILFLLSKNVALSYVVEEIKRNSSRWIKTIDEYYINFSWQGGYGAFSVSQSVVDKTISYIENQRVHHSNTSYNDEYVEFLDLYQVE